jgi:O-acetyl-ADP-ribose deacetylase (regulator of RNase III)
MNSNQIVYKKGDVTKPENKNKFILMHCCNDKGVYNAGVAKAIRRKWNGAYRSYYIYVAKNRSGDILGTVDFWKNPEKEMYVANCIGQRSYGRISRKYVNYKALRKCFQQIRKFNENKNYDIICPKLGSGLAGGDWNIISKIVEEEICEYGMNVCVYEL